MAQATKKGVVYRVTFEWGTDYNNMIPGVTSISINVIEAANKFDALKTAFDLVAPIVYNQEPRKMNVDTRES